LRVTDATVSEIARVPSRFQYAVDGGYSSAPFSPEHLVDASDSLIYVSSAERYEIAVYESHGRLRRILRRTVAPVPVTDSVIAEEKRRRLAEAPAEGRADIEKNLARANYPSSMPAIGRFLVDRAGNLWVQAYQPESDDTKPTSWIVFGPSGAARALATLPARAIRRVTDIAGDRVIAVLPELMTVQVFRLRKLPHR
jgi:hypothetical protein